MSLSSLKDSLPWALAPDKLTNNRDLPYGGSGAPDLVSHPRQQDDEELTEQLEELLITCTSITYVQLFV